MNTSSWFAGLEQAHTSYLLLATLAGIVAGGRRPVPDRADRLGLAGPGPGGREGRSGRASCSGSVCSRGLRGRYSWRSSAVFSSWAGWPAVRCRA